MQGQGPCDPPFGRSAPNPGRFCGTGSPCTHRCRRSALHPGDFLMRRKSPKTHQEPPGSWTSGTRGRTPLDSPTFYPSGIGCDNLNLQASSKPRHLPSHGLKTESVSSIEPKEKTRPICPPTQSGRSVYFCGTNLIEGVAACRRGSGSEK